MKSPRWVVAALRGSVGCATVALGIGWSSVAQAVDVFSQGMAFPQTISQVPEWFGSCEGDYLVPDPLGKNVWRVPQSGGPADVFSDLSSFGAGVLPMGGLFLPETGWGSQSGRFLIVASNSDNPPPAPWLGPPGDMYTCGSDGVAELLVTLSGQEEALGAPFMISPRVGRFVPGWFGSGSKEGQLALTDFQGALFLIRPLVQPDNSLRFDYELLYDHNREGIAGTVLDSNPWDGIFAPADFGAVGGTVLLSDSHGGEIISVNETGEVNLFTTITLLEGQKGLRNMAFGPVDFLLDSLGIPGQQLFVSVTATTGTTAGTVGDVLALDANGNVVASLRTLDDLEKFDPRGLFFTENGELIISDASDPMILALPEDFRLGRYGNVPEPSIGCLLALGLLAVWVRRRWSV